MKNIIVGLLMALVVGGQAHASLIVDFSGDEIRTVNKLLSCPNEVQEVMNIKAIIGRGHRFTDRPGTVYTYTFVSKDNPSIDLGWITIKKLRGEKVECKIDWVH